MSSGENIRVAVVTGANKGIGLAVVKELCKQFTGVVYLTARDEGRGKAAVAELESAGLHPRFFQLDLDDEASIIRLRDHLQQQYGGLDILVNNAAIAYKNDSAASVIEQAENTLRVNFTETLSVCNLLFPLLRPGARVVNVSSSCGLATKIPNLEIRKKFTNPNLTVEELVATVQQFIESVRAGTHQKEGWGNSMYVVSKVALSALTRLQHKAFLNDPRPDIVINHIHPGYVDTDMTSHRGPLTPEQGAVSSVYAALLPPGTTSPRGDFIWFDKKILDWETGIDV